MVRKGYRLGMLVTPWLVAVGVGGFLTMTTNTFEHIE
jgi:hypothetical protein